MVWNCGGHVVACSRNSGQTISIIGKYKANFSQLLHLKIFKLPLLFFRCVVLKKWFSNYLLLVLLLPLHFFHVSMKPMQLSIAESNVSGNKIGFCFFKLEKRCLTSYKMSLKVNKGFFFNIWFPHYGLWRSCGQKKLEYLTRLSDLADIQ